MRWSTLFALCLLVAGEANAGVPTAGQDSITVDGVPILLSLSVTEEGQNDGGPDRNVRAKRTGAPPAFSTSLFVGSTALAGNVAGLPVARFAGRGLRPSVGIQGQWLWSGPRMSWRLGLELGAWSDVHYDTRQLEDSLYALEPDDQGGIRQLTRQTYDLGIELDTVPLVLDQAGVWTSAITLEWRKSKRGRGRSKWSMWGGVWARVIQSPRGETAAERVPESGWPDPRTTLGDQRGDWIAETTWGAGAFATLEKAWSKQWAGFIRFDLHAGQRQYSGLRLGLTRRFRRS